MQKMKQFGRRPKRLAGSLASRHSKQEREREDVPAAKDGERREEVGAARVIGEGRGEAKEPGWRRLGPLSDGKDRVVHGREQRRRGGVHIDEENALDASESSPPRRSRRSQPRRRASPPRRAHAQAHLDDRPPHADAVRAACLHPHLHAAGDVGRDAVWGGCWSRVILGHRYFIRISRFRCRIWVSTVRDIA
jgi:hypothetical protein